MKKLLYVIFSLVFVLWNGTPAYSNELENNGDNLLYTCTVKNELSEEANHLNIFLAQYFKAFQTQNLNELNELYADIYISGDKLNKESVIDLIKQSWSISDSFEYTNKIQDIRFDTNFASIEISESIKGLTKTKSDITKDNGLIDSNVRTILYLQKFGKGWKIISDKTVYEQTTIKYGKAKELAINVSAPEIVFGNTNYSIALTANVPADTFALGAITNEPLVYPLKNSEEIFRQVPPELNILERVVKANNSSFNELAVASISFCAIKQGEVKVPEIDITGTAVVFKRVNVE